MADENLNCWTKFDRLCFSRRIVMGCVNLASAALGIGVGVLLRSRGPLSMEHRVILQIPPLVLKWTLSVLAGPFIMSNMIIGVSRANMSSSRRISSRAMTYFVLSTILSVLLGILLVCLIQPGAGVKGVEDDDDDEDNEAFSTIYSISDLFRNIFSTNVIKVFFKKYKTLRVQVKPEADDYNSVLKASTQVQIVGEYVDELNILGLVTVSFITGMALRSFGEGAPFVDQIIYLNDLFKFVFKLIICYFPVAVVCLMVSFICEVKYSWELLISLGKFTAAVLGGLVIHGAVVLPLIYLMCTRKNPLPVIRGASSAFLHVLLVPCSFNMIGTAFYEMAVAVYIIQLNGLALDWDILFTIGVAVVLVAVGEAGVPATGPVTTLFILSATGVSVRNVALPLAVEWLLYFCSPVVNILGNCFGVALVAHLSKEDLENMNEQENTSAPTNPQGS